MESISDNITEYIEYVNHIAKEFGNIAKLVREEEVTPQRLNYALAMYYEVADGLNSEYQRVKAEYLELDHQYTEWYDLKFEEARKEVIYEYSAEIKGSIKPSVKEFEIRLRTKNSVEYAFWRKRLDTAESKMRFIIRKMDIHKKYDGILTTLSNNMRQEMRTLSLESRMNADPERASRNKIRTEFPDVDEEESEEVPPRRRPVR